MGQHSVAIAPFEQVAIDQEAIATVKLMESDEIQAFRKGRLREAIGQFFDGKNISALAIPGQFSRNVQVIQYPDDSLDLGSARTKGMPLQLLIAPPDRDIKATD